MNFKDSFSWWIVAIVLLVVTVIVFIVNGNTWATQVLAACLGAVITIIATRLLLSSQSIIDEKQRNEEAQENRRLELYNAKLKVYSDFVSKMFDILRDNKIEQDEILDLRSRILGQVSFYANGDIMKSINKELKEVEDVKNPGKILIQFANIANILQKDLRTDLKQDWNSSPQNAYNLWETFDTMLDNSISSESEELKTKTTPNTEENNSLSQGINNGFWHFAMWDAKQQIDALCNGVNELNLVEYGGEEWRTNLLKQVKKDDLIFLFRSGGKGYMGVFRALGWRVFKFDQNVIKETLFIFDEQIEPTIITDEAKVKKDLERSDIYDSYADGATICSSIIVEPLAFSQEGINNPGGVYRRTISRYDHGYGLMQLARFMAVMNDNNVYDVYYNGVSTVKVGCNKELFVNLLERGNIQPAERDADGNWL